MYLSRIALNDKLRDTMRALASLQILHGAVESCFSGDAEKERERTLWRIDYLGGVCYLMILSSEKPNLEHISAQFGYDYNVFPWETRDYDILLRKIAEGQKWRFRLNANPVRNSTKDRDMTSRRGGIHAHVTPEQQKKWLSDRVANCGFSVDADAFDVTHSEWKVFSKAKEGAKVTLRTASFEGVLTVTDAELFKKTLTGGIGRAKAYGCGLITIARTEKLSDE